MATIVNEALVGGLMPRFSRFSLELRGEMRKQAHLSCLSSPGKTRAHCEQRGHASQIDRQHGKREHIGNFFHAAQFDLTNHTAMLFAVRAYRSKRSSQFAFFFNASP